MSTTAPHRRRSRRPRLVYLSAALLVLLMGFPTYWMINTALSSRQQLFTEPQSLWLQFTNWSELSRDLDGVPVVSMLTNSAFIAIGTTVLTILLSVLCAYALSRYKFHGRGAAAFLLFSTQMVPQGVFLIPIYTLFLGLGLVNNLWGLVLVNAAFSLPISTFIIKAAIDGIPYELEEAARVDNSPPLSTLTVVILPLILPSIAAAAVLAFFAGWGELMYATTFITDRAEWPASVGLSVLVSQPGVSMPAVMAVSVMFAAPAVAFFLFVQRHIVSGLTAGAVKG
ncbi:carbohydrate ABC transporter permease [Nesterenkonia muleiensis]|uniref:carbohydrate ABC transporter permease n=1 Tax=Nesterenkonia muleiensis TaxID=2282648 RepID=UPI000E72B769|nr:carbohydrate ABC transporter permease [Nesterenkonia muleiensis]